MCFVSGMCLRLCVYVDCVHMHMCVCVCVCMCECVFTLQNKMHKKIQCIKPKMDWAYLSPKILEYS